MATFFITGIDTGVGKTHATSALLHALRGRGIDACGYKPVASGCERTADGLRNDDALALLAASGGGECYEAINPVALEPAIAPHLAARRAGITIDLALLNAGHEALAARHETVLVEGAGGWLVPLDDKTSFADWVAARGWPVILVVALRLGCINHTLLTAEAITRRTRLAGWIANCLPPEQAEWRENLSTIASRIEAPLLGCLPAGMAPVRAAARLDTTGLWPC